MSWKRPKPNTWLASQCIMRHKAVVSFDSHGKETRRRIDFGVMPVKLPWRGEELRLVVVRGFGQKPMMLLTNLAVNEKLQAEGKDGTDHSYKALWQVVEGYLSRWRVEETIPSSSSATASRTSASCPTQAGRTCPPWYW